MMLLTSRDNRHRITTPWLAAGQSWSLYACRSRWHQCVGTSTAFDSAVGSGDPLAFLTAFGASFPDQDADGVCDDLDECVGEYI